MKVLYKMDQKLAWLITLQHLEMYIMGILKLINSKEQGIFNEKMDQATKVNLVTDNMMAKVIWLSFKTRRKNSSILEDLDMVFLMVGGNLVISVPKTKATPMMAIS